MFMTASAIRALNATEFGRLSLVITASLFLQGIFRSASSEVIRISREYRTNSDQDSHPDPKWPEQNSLIALASLVIGGGLVGVSIRDPFPFLFSSFSATQALRYDLRVRSWSIQSYFPHASSAVFSLIIGAVVLRIAPPLDLEGVLVLWLALEVIALVVGGLVTSYSRRDQKQQNCHPPQQGRLRIVLFLDFLTQFAFIQSWTLIFAIQSVEAAGHRQVSLFLWAPFTFLLQATHQPINRYLRQVEADESVKRVRRITGWLVSAAAMYGAVIVVLFPLINRLFLGGNADAARKFLYAQILAGILQALASAATTFFFTPTRQAKMTAARFAIAGTTCGGAFLWQLTGHSVSSLVIITPYALLSAFALGSLRRVSEA